MPAIWISFKYKSLCYTNSTVRILRHIVFMSFPLTPDVLTRHRTRHKLAPVSFRFTTLSRGFFLQTLPTSVCLILCLGSVYISRNVPKRVPDSNFSYWNKLERNSHSYSGARNSKRPQDVKCCLWPHSVWTCTMKNLCFIATFDCLNIPKDFYMPWDIYLFRQI